MKKISILILTFFSLSNLVTAQIQKGLDIDGEIWNDQSGSSVSMPDVNTVAIGARMNNGNGNNSGHVRIYRWVGSAWTQKGGDIDGEYANDLSGYSVSMADSNTVAIGAIYNGGNGVESGHVRIYRWIGNSWVQKGFDIDGEVANNESGFSVSMPDSNTVAIGARKNHGNGLFAGHARVFTWDGNTWLQKGLDIDGESAGDESGYSVCMPDSNTIAISARKNDGNGNNAGHVRIFAWDGIEWVQKGDDIDGEATGDGSGRSVSMPDKNTIAIGAPRNDVNGSKNNAGHVRIYSWNGTIWLQKGGDIDGEKPNDKSGISVCMPDSNTVAIGAPENNGNGSNSGHTRVYRWNGGTWLQVGIDIDGESGGDLSGGSVSMPNNYTVAIGAADNNGYGSNSGHTRVYEFKGVFGQIHNDLNENCIREENSIVPSIKGLILPGNILVETDEFGRWFLDSLAAGTYTITYDTSGSWRATCTNPQSFTVNNPNEPTHISSFGLVNLNPCPELTISLNMPFRRPGLGNQRIFVWARNEVWGTGALDNASIVLRLDSFLTIQYASLPFTPLGNNEFQFDVDTINPGDLKTFNVACSLSSNARMNRTICMEAELYPQPGCIFDSITPAPSPPDFNLCALPWDNSDLSIIGWCQNDSIYFTITNDAALGIGNMDCYSPVRLYIDAQYISLDSIKLLGGQSDTLIYSADGRTFRLEVDQHPLHPGLSKPNATVELCGDMNNWTKGMVNILPMDDADPIIDIFCDRVRASYDPNDKAGYPLGVTASHFVAPNGKLDYTIRFQNTGNDTAFKVVIRDTLDTDLDIFSVRSGVSSHGYSFNMYGPRVLEWTFDNIMLPDSSVDLEGSSGFVTFTVKQVPDLPDLTEINNSVGIYFDFNSPVLTNTTSHIVKRECVGTPTWTEQNVLYAYACDEYTYNLITYTNPGTYWQIEGDTLVTLHLTLDTADAGITNIAPTLIAKATGLNYQWLNCDSNFAIIPGETNPSFTASEDGKYALVVSESNCIDTSVCIPITTFGVLENSFESVLKVYPNPTSGELTIDLSENLSEVIVIIRNQLGQDVLKQTFKNSNLLQLNIPGETGVYLIEVSSGDKKAVMSVVKE